MIEDEGKKSKEEAYHAWLGIPPKEQPPNHYQLLRISNFEGSVEVIRCAAERAISYLQNFNVTVNAELAQEIQLEVTKAAKVLKKPELKQQYDLNLAEKIKAEETSSKSVEDIIQIGVQTSIVLAEQENWLVGWHPEKCDIVVDNKFVSSTHCVLFFDGSDFEIEDLDSKNGTYVNGVKLTPRTRFPVTEKDTVTLGRSAMMPWPPIHNS